MLFDQDELVAWLQQGRIEAEADASEDNRSGQNDHLDVSKACPGPVDISPSGVYHRSPRYR